MLICLVCLTDDVTDTGGRFTGLQLLASSMLSIVCRHPLRDVMGRENFLIYFITGVV